MARFTVSITDELKQKLDEFAAAESYNRSQALEEILRTHFQLPTTQEPKQLPSPGLDDTKKIDDIESHLSSVMQFLAHQYDYLVTLDKRVDYLQTGPEVPYPEWYESFISSEEPEPESS